MIRAKVLAFVVFLVNGQPIELPYLRTHHLLDLHWSQWTVVDESRTFDFVDVGGTACADASYHDVADIGNAADREVGVVSDFQGPKAASLERVLSRLAGTGILKPTRLRNILGRRL